MRRKNTNKMFTVTGLSRTFGGFCLCVLDAAFLLTVGSFLLTVERFYLQLRILAFWLAIGASLLTISAFLLTVGVFLAHSGKVRLIKGLKGL